MHSIPVDTQAQKHKRHAASYFWRQLAHLVLSLCTFVEKNMHIRLEADSIIVVQASRHAEVHNLFMPARTCALCMETYSRARAGVCVCVCVCDCGHLADIAIQMTDLHLKWICHDLNSCWRRPHKSKDCSCCRLLTSKFKRSRPEQHCF